MKDQNFELITALADGEITDTDEKSGLISLLETDADLRYEYSVQMLMKSLISERLKITKAPDELRSSVIRKINPEKKKGFLSFFIPDFAASRPVIAYGSAAVILLAIVLLIFNRPPQVPFSPQSFVAEQTGNENMYVQAKNNFRSIMEGKLTPQLVSSDAETIQKFFVNEGVNYSTIIPRHNNWNLLGAVVSVDQGEKFAHHVYTTNEGQLVYLFQVEKSYIEKHKILQLSDNLYKFIDEGNCFDTSDGELTTLMTKVQDNVFAVVSNLPAQELEEVFCNLN